jgi:ankyrin repeat protein
LSARLALALVAVSLLLGVPARSRAAEQDCRDIEVAYDTAKSGITSVELNTALFVAASKGCLALARRLIAAGASVAARDRRGAMPLAHAARAGSVGAVQLFLGAGAAIDARDIDGATALYRAAEGEHPSTVALLLENGADPNLTGSAAVSPLAAAAYRGNDRIVEALLARGARPDTVDATGKAPIVYAAARGFEAVVRRLLDAGVGVATRYGHGLTALMWAAGHEDGVGARAAIDVVDLLIVHGAPLDAVDDRGRTALMIAAERGDGAVVTALLRHAADPTVKDMDGKTARELAANDAVRAAFGER